MCFSQKVYFSPIFLKLWAHISDNIALVVGCSQCNYRDYWTRIDGFKNQLNTSLRGYRHRDFLLVNKYLDDVFTFKDLVGFEKT